MNERPQLLRGLGLVSAISIVVGTIIGTGIFLTPSAIATQVGSVGLVFLVWIFAGLLSLAGALSYAELGAMIPEAGGEYVYLRRAYGPVWGFLYGWEAFVIGKTGSIATIATGFALFLGFFVGDVFRPLVSVPLGFATLNLTILQVIALTATIGLTVVNYIGVVLGGRVQTVFTVLKVLIVVGLAGFAFLSNRGDAGNFTPLLAMPKGAAGTLSAFGFALVGALWAYDGWNNLTMVASEIKDPGRNIPRALIFGTGAVIVIYLFINAAYFYMLPLEAIQSSASVGQDMARGALGAWGATLISLGMVVSAFATLNAAILSGARIPFAMARDGLFFRFTSTVHPAHRTPSKALILQAAFACLLILLLGNDRDAFSRMFTYTIFGLWIFYGLTTASVFVLRHKEPDLPRPYKTFGYPWIPGAFVAVAAVFVVNTVYNSPADTGLGVLFILAGLPFYWWWKRKGETQS